MTFHAEIAGGGFAGLAAAIGLAQAGWTVRLHEAAPAHRSLGSGIYVHPFAQTVLQGLGALERVAAIAFTPTERVIHVDGTRRSAIDLGGKVLTTTRAALHDALVATAEAAGVEIVTGSEAQAAGPDGTLHLRNGSRNPADLVIAADGVRAALAQAAGFAIDRRRHQDGITRVLLDRAELRGPEWDAVHDFYDYRVRPLRILYTPCGTDVFYFCLMAPATDAAAAAVPLDAALWSRSFPHLAPTLNRIGALGRHDRYTTTTMPRWSEGRLAVIGDAAHAMPSALGQGAGVSMLNAALLVKAVLAAPDVPAGLAAWERDARPVVEGWQQEAGSVASSRSLSGAVHPGEDFPTERNIVQHATAGAQP